MAFSKKTWKNRNSQYPTRRILTRVDTQVSTTYDVTRDEGTVTEAGDDFSAENMNDLETRIKNAFDDAVANKANKVDLTNISITGSTNNTGATISSGTFFYKDGDLVRAKTSIANGATLTLNTNYELVTAGGLNNLNASLTKVSGIKKIVHGTTTVTTSSTGSTLYPFGYGLTTYAGMNTVLFPSGTGFSSTPIVLLSSPSELNSGYWNVWANKVDSAGFVVTVHGNSGNKTVTINWIAIELE